ncbi:metallophosphoesterase [Microvirga yunnanensis]|uniref:metallophosphoesterase n=1 Tax=Microvirga yunnanensis TaxID=2953740 RepID=UPI0021C5DA3D|nr:metallophosphoesterase [Microvirga sp. HBU65207]
MNRPVNILHLTDFHYSKRNEDDQRMIIDALLADVTKLSDGSLKPDLIVFSGDLVDRADDPNVYDYFYDLLLDPLTKAARCGDSRVVFTAGNHDTHRSVVQKQKHRHDGLIRDLNSREKLNQIYRSGELDDFVVPRFKGFLDLRDYIVSESGVAFRNAFASVQTFPDLSLATVDLNSSWMGYAGVDSIRDERKLLIPEAAINQALSHVPNGFAAVLVTHHPSDWLMEWNEADFLATVDGKFSAKLFGHMHEARPHHIGSFKGTCLFSQGGALYATREWYIGYSLIRLDPATGHVEAHLRTWYEKRREFDAAVDLVDRGIFHSSDAARAHFYKYARAVDRSALRIWCQDVARPAMEAEFNEGLTNRKLSDIFVAPPLYTKPTYEEREGEDVAEHVEISISFEEIAKSNGNYVITGSPEYGKTTLLRQMALKLVQVPDRAATPTVPVVINFGKIRPGEGRIEALIREALPELPAGCQLRELLSEGLITLLVDDVIISDPMRYPALRRFITNNPKNRFIFTAPASRNERYLSAIDADLPVSLERVSIRPLGRREMRTLVERWDSERRFDCDEVLDRVLAEIRNINIPVTAVNGTILLSILEDNTNFTPINRAVLIEQFIEVLLEKRAPEESERRHFDFTNRTHYLSHVAALMAQTNTYVFDVGEFHRITKDYLNQFGLAQDPEDLITLCLTARIFVKRPDGNISFGYRAFLEFFIARHMKDNDAFRSWVLDETRYLSFVNEIQFYASIGRNDEALLDLIGSRLDKLADDLFETKPDLRLVDKFKVEVSGTSDEILDAVGAQLQAPPLTDEERDELLEADLPQDVEGRQEVFRPVPGDAASRYFTCLVIYSNVLRNLELIPDQMKRHHLGRALEAWGNLFTASLIAIPLLARNRRMRLNGVAYEIVVPKHFTESQVARIIFLDFPNAMSKLLFATVGTEKLQRQLTEPQLAESGEPKLIKFFRHSLCMDLRLGDWPTQLEAFAADLRDNRYLLEGMLWKANEIYTLGSMPKLKRTKLAQVMAGILGSIRGATRVDRAKIANDQLNAYKRQDLVRRLQAKQVAE